MPKQTKNDTQLKEFSPSKLTIQLFPQQKCHWYSVLILLHGAKSGWKPACQIQALLSGKDACSTSLFFCYVLYKKSSISLKDWYAHIVSATVWTFCWNVGQGSPEVVQDTVYASWREIKCARFTMNKEQKYDPEYSCWDILF